jgi:hypothetical protein
MLEVLQVLLYLIVDWPSKKWSEIPIWLRLSILLLLAPLIAIFLWLWLR